MSADVSVFASLSLMDDFDDWERMAGHSPATRKRRHGTLARFKRDTPVWPVDRQGERRTIERWLGRFGDPQTRRSYLGDLRAFFSWAFDRDLVAYDPTVGIPNPKVPSRRPNPLTDAEVVACFDACSCSQDRLAIGLGVLAGLRVSEMAHLKHRDVDHVSRNLYVRQGKGNKDRVLPISDGLELILLDCGHTMTSNVGDVVSRRIKEVFARAGVTGHHPHDLRATFATKLIRENVDLVTVQHFLGHASVATTQRYIAPDDRGVELVNRLSFAA